MPTVRTLTNQQMEEFSPAFDVPDTWPGFSLLTSGLSGHSKCLMTVYLILYWAQWLYPPVKCSYPRCMTILQLDALQAHQLHMKHRTHIKNPKHWIYQTCFILICNIRTSLQTVTPFYNDTLDKVTKQINLAITAAHTNWSMAGLLLFLLQEGHCEDEEFCPYLHESYTQVTVTDDIYTFIATYGVLAPCCTI